MSLPPPAGGGWHWVYARTPDALQRSMSCITLWGGTLYHLGYNRLLEWIILRCYTVVQYVLSDTMVYMA